MKDRVNYEAIQDHIRAAQLQRSIYVAELLSTAIIITYEKAKDVSLATWKFVVEAADIMLSMTRERTKRNVFTIE